MLENILRRLLNSSFMRKYRSIVMTLIDLSLVFVSFGLSYLSRYGSHFSKININHVISTIGLALLVYLVMFIIFGISKSLWRFIGSKELSQMGCAITIATLLLIVIDPLLNLRGEIILYLLSGVLTFLFMTSLRFVYRWIRYSSVAQTKDAKKALIIGAGKGGYILLKELKQNPDQEANVVGFIDDYRPGRVVSGVKVLGTTADLPEIVEAQQIEKLFIAMPSESKETIRRIYNICKELPCKTQIMQSSNALLADDPDAKFVTKDVSIEDLLGRGEVKLEQSELEEYISGKTILVTGAGGSIGSELCRQIVKFVPKKLIMVDINENGLYMLEQEFNRNRVHGKLDKTIEIVSVITSIRDGRAIDKLFANEKPDAVYHAAAHKHVPLMETTPIEAIKNNVFGTNNVIQSCIKNNVGRFIMISTDKAVNPTNVMGATKRMTELLLQANAGRGITKMAAVRFGNVLGSNGSVIPIFKNQIAEGGPITITDKKIIRYFMTIPEAAQLVLQAGYYADKGEIFVLDMGEPVKIIDLAENLIRLSGLVPYKDIDIVEIGLRPGEKMYEELRHMGENTSRTKNDLIFVNQSSGITFDEVQAKLEVLDKVIQNNTTLSNVEIKETMMEIIKI